LRYKFRPPTPGGLCEYLYRREVYKMKVPKNIIPVVEIKAELGVTGFRLPTGQEIECEDRSWNGEEYKNCWDKETREDVGAVRPAYEQDGENFVLVGVEIV